MKSTAHTATVQAVRPIQAPTAPRFDADRLGAAMQSIAADLQYASTTRRRVTNLVGLVQYAVAANAAFVEMQRVDGGGIAQGEAGDVLREALNATECLDLSAAADVLTMALDELGDMFAQVESAELAAKASLRANTATVAGF